MSDTALKAIAGALAGAVLGWAGHGLTTLGRVDAIERTLQRIESRLDAITTPNKTTADAAPTR